MSGLLGGGGGQASTPNRIQSMQISRTAYGDCIPLVYGRTRLAGTLLWYGNFTATEHQDPNSSGGKGGGGGGGSTSYTYSAALVIGLCEGPLTSIELIYADKTQTDSTTLSFSLKTGTSGQTALGFLTSPYNLGYDHTALIGSSSFQLGGSAAMPNLTYELTGLLPYSLATSILDAMPPAILADYLANAEHGAGFAYLDPNMGTSNGTRYVDYCGAMGFFLSPAETTQRSAAEFVSEICEITNSAPVWSSGILKIIPRCDETVTGNGFTYTPNLTPWYDFDDEDYIDDDGMPVRHTRKPASQRYNKVRIEYLNRAHQYNTDIAEATDDADSSLNGPRVLSTLTWHSITTSLVGRQCAQLRLQRELYVLNTYQFKVRIDYCLLEPMDLVTITDSVLGLDRQLVRITEIEDDENDTLTITAEEVPIGNANAPVYNWDDAQGYAANYGIDPGSILAPVMFSAPPLLISSIGGYELWIAIAGTGSAWGGATVWMSFDNTTYKKVGVVRAAARFGTLHSSIANVADPDTTSTLVVDMTASRMQLLPATTDDADNARSLIFVDGEIMAYRDCSLAATSRYNLGYLRRGQYGSAVASHTSGTDFVRLDDRIFKIPFDNGNLGKTVYLKFTSFNIYGGAEQSLASATAYSRTLAAASVSLGAGADGTSVYVQYSADGSTGWHDPPFVSGTDTYMRIKQGTGAWSDAMLIASAATGYKIIFIRAPSQPSTPSGSSPAGWSATPPSANGNPLWYSQAILNADGSISGAWSTPVQLEGRQGLGTATLQFYNADRSGNTIYKTGGGASWLNSSAWSLEGYANTHAAASPLDSTNHVMWGINSDPTTDYNYTSIDYAWYFSAGTASVRESGTSKFTSGAYALTDVFSILQADGLVLYYKNGNLVYTSTVPASAGQYFFDSSFDENGAGIQNLRFGPPPNTDSIAPNAATEIASIFVALSSNCYFSSSAGYPNLTIAGLTIPAQDNPYEAIVTATGTVNHNAASGSQSSTYAVITDMTAAGSYDGPQAFGTEDTIGRNASTGASQFIGSFTRESRYSVSANTLKMFALHAGAMYINAPGSVCTLSNVLFKVEIRKR